MGRGKAFKDKDRIVLMLIKEQHSNLKLREIKQVFDIIFPEKKRTAVALRQQWLYRRTEKKADWNAARRNLSHKKENAWTHQITSAVNRVRGISNANAAQVEAGGETEGETEGETGDEAHNPPAKRQKLSNSNSTADEDLQETLQGPETDTEREIVAVAQGQVDEQEAPDAPGGGTTYNKDEGGDEATYAPEAASVQRAAPGGTGEATHSHAAANVQHTALGGGGGTGRDDGSASQHSEVRLLPGLSGNLEATAIDLASIQSASATQGEWQFVSEGDARLADQSVSGLDMPFYPNASKVLWWISKQRRLAKPTILADGIYIKFVPGARLPGT